MINEATRDFIHAHADDDVCRLALTAKAPPGVDLRAALGQIEGLRRLRHKAPHFASLPGVELPGRIPLEQCSGEATAAYKAALVGRIVVERGSMADLTGGLGVDFMALSPLFEASVYVEHNEELCALARSNFATSGLRGYSVVCGSAEEFTATMKPTNFVFIDPARRMGNNRKAVLLSDCSPDVTKLLPALRLRCRYLMLKLSPMLDITAATVQLGNCREVHIVATAGEVKEIIVFIDFSADWETSITCCDTAAAPGGFLTFTRAEEHDATCVFTDEIGKFLYEPDATVLKAGAFKLMAQRFGLRKLHPNTHLYTSDEKKPGFTGRIFEVEAVTGFSKQDMRAIASRLGRANVTVRNFPLTAEELRNRLKLKEGGESRVFAATIASGRHVLIVCRPVK